MAVQIQRWTQLTPTSNQTVSFTTSFTPSCVILRASINTSAGLAAGMSICFGMAAGSNQVAFSTRATDNSTSPSVGNSQNVGDLLILYDPSATGTVLAAAAINGGLTSTGFGLQFTTTSATQYEYTVYAIGGDVSSAEMIALSSPGSTGNHAYSTTLGTPTAALFASANATTSGTGGNASVNGMTLGWAASSSSQGVSMTEGTTSAKNGEQLTNACICTGAGLIVGALSSFGSNTCTINFSATGSGIYTWGLFLYGSFNVVAFSNNSPTSNGNQSNSLSFSPMFAVVQTLGAVASGSLQTVTCQSIGTCDSNGNADTYVGVWVNPPKSGDSVAKSWYSGGVLLNGFNSSATSVVEASVANLTNGVTADFTTTQSGTQYQYIGFAIGSLAVTDTGEFSDDCSSMWGTSLHRTMMVLSRVKSALDARNWWPARPAISFAQGILRRIILAMQTISSQMTDAISNGNFALLLTRPLRQRPTGRNATSSYRN